MSLNKERGPRILLWGIIVAGLALRVWGLSHNLPYKDYVEEDEFIYTALKYGTGDLNPHWFFHPPLYSYVLFCFYVGYYCIGTAAGWFGLPRDFVVQYIIDPSAFYMIARCLSVLLFVPTVFALYALATRLYSARCALIACIFFTVMPLHVWYSHFGCTEPLVVLFGLLTALSAARLMDSGEKRDALIAGIFAGFTIGTKYVGASVVCLLIAASLASGKGRRWRSLAVSMAAAVAGFLAVCPHAVLVFHEYIANVRLLASQPLSVGEFAWVEQPRLHIVFATRYIPEGMGGALAITSLAGIVYLWLRHRRSDILIAIVPTAFYAVIGFSRLYYDRYMLVCYPFFAIAAAVLVDALSGRVPRARLVLDTALCSAIALPSLALCTERISSMMLPATSFVAAEWITKNIPGNSRILADDVITLPMTEKSIMREQALKEKGLRSPFGYRVMSRFFFDLQRQAARGRKGFEVTYIYHPRGFHMVGGGKGYEAEWMTPELMRAQMEHLSDYDYIVIASHKAWRYRDREQLPERFRFMTDFYRSVGKKCELVKSFGGEKGKSQGSTVSLYKVPPGPGIR